ncbi:helix-turn-helix transcriptional regulator [Neotamlana sedimentorum]|uniref:helix-turn-helix transcriptional regulator n=1 Tax=Neotamlana sedimentorum TaxID=1435349 RepID=UPI000699A6D9|nr:helix-turn-helix transcriptional regulator [Tamlana sedimentorum]
MDYQIILRYIILIGIIQGLLFNLIVFIKRRKFTPSVKYLNIVVLCLSLNNLREFIFDGDFFSKSFIYVYLTIPWHFFIVPMFYAFLVFYLRLNGKRSNYLCFTYVIFFIEIVTRLVLIVFIENFEKVFADYMVFEEMVNAMYSIFIFYNIIKLVFFNKKSTFEIDLYYNLHWVKNILKFGSILMILWVVALIYYFFTRSAWVYDPLKLFYSVLIYWLGYEGLVHTKILNDRISIRNDIAYQNFNLKPVTKNYQSTKHNLFNKKQIKELVVIQNYIIVQKKFLDPFLSLSKLAEELDMSVSHLSQLINTYGHKSFTDLINFYRIEHAKKLLSDKEFKHYKIVAIGMESGFNSKSTFYSAFKKYTSVTPSVFRSKF